MTNRSKTTLTNINWGKPPSERASKRRAARERTAISLRSHEPPRNSGEGTAVDGPMPLGEKDDAFEQT